MFKATSLPMLWRMNLQYTPRGQASTCVWHPYSRNHSCNCASCIVSPYLLDHSYLHITSAICPLKKFSPDYQYPNLLRLTAIYQGPSSPAQGRPRQKLDPVGWAMPRWTDISQTQETWSPGDQALSSAPALLLGTTAQSHCLCSLGGAWRCSIANNNPTVTAETRRDETRQDKIKQNCSFFFLPSQPFLLLFLKPGRLLLYYIHHNCFCQLSVTSIC